MLKDAFRDYGIRCREASYDGPRRLNVAATEIERRFLWISERYQHPGDNVLT